MWSQTLWSTVVWTATAGHSKKAGLNAGCTWVMECGGSALADKHPASYTLIPPP